MIGTAEMLDVYPGESPQHWVPFCRGSPAAWSPFPLHDYLIDIGTMENYQKAQATWPGFPQA
jgi:hypothetical protein